MLVWSKASSEVQKEELVNTTLGDLSSCWLPRPWVAQQGRARCAEAAGPGVVSWVGVHFCVLLVLKILPETTSDRDVEGEVGRATASAWVE